MTILAVIVSSVLVGTVFGFVGGCCYGASTTASRYLPRLSRLSERLSESRQLFRDVAKAWGRYREADRARLQPGAGKVEVLKLLAARRSLENLLGTEHHEAPASGIVSRDAASSSARLAS